MPSITVICLNDEESINVVNGMLVAWNSALGNAFNLEPLSASQFQARIASGNYEAALYTLRAGGTTPYDVLKSFESTASPTLLQNEEYDSALRSLTFDLASYQAAEQLLQEQYVFYPLFRDQTHYAPAQHPGHHGFPGFERQLHQRPEAVKIPELSLGDFLIFRFLCSAGPAHNTQPGSRSPRRGNSFPQSPPRLPRPPRH